MNIAIFTDTYLPDINGVATSAKILKDELLKHNHHVLVVTTELPSNSDYYEEHVVRVGGIDIKKLYGYRLASFYSFEGMREVREFNPDIVHCQTEFGVGIFGKIVGEILGVPVCYTYHTMWKDYTHYISRGKHPIDDAMKKIVELISKFYGDSCARLIVPAKKTAQALQSYGIKKDITVIPTGLELDRFYNYNKEHVFSIRKQYRLTGFTLIYLGRIAPEKSIDVLIRSMTHIVSRDNSIKLLVVGNGPQLDELKKLSKSLNLSDNIIFTGAKNADVISDYYHASDLFVNASTSETQGLTYFEAMACSLPVLARYDSNLEDVIVEGENGYFFHDEQEFTDRVLNLASSNLNTLKKNALKKAQYYDSEHFYQSIINVYTQMRNEVIYSYQLNELIEGKNGYTAIFIHGKYETHLHITKDIIQRYGLVKGIEITREELDALIDLEHVHDAYYKALKWLTYKDYTYIMMKEKLLENGRYNSIQVDMTMDLLLSKHLINDYDYTMDYLSYMINKGYGLKKASLELKNKGVSPSTIDQCLAEFSADLEYDAAVEIIKKLYKENNKYSPKALLNYIRKRLFNKGFSNDVVEQAMNNINFEFPAEHTRLLLEKEYNRVYSRYKLKFDGHLLKTKIITFLVQKGYSYDLVLEIIEEKWDENAENK
ncbi:MAG: glycosyltransferase [Eggerthia catenaformis]|uniref:glycosyltransferase n=1 Tax=Eggerthia catenaformis TaxID=31973 RepID=UPI000A3632BF|nr:hypothetical protein B7939_05040 [Eggerthia catenaformis]